MGGSLSPIGNYYWRVCRTSNFSNYFTMLARTAPRCVRHVQSVRHNSSAQPLYLNPHKWAGLPADRIFELHEMRKTALGDKYVPNDAERLAILATFESLRAPKPVLTYGYELDNFKERVMNNTPSRLRGLPPKLSNIRVFDKGATPHEQRKIEQVHRVSAYEMPLLAKYRQAYQPRAAAETPLQFTFNTDFGDESNAANRKVALAVRLADLQLDQQQQRKFQLLAGNKYNHNTGVFRLATARFPEAMQNARWLAETFSRLLAEARDLTQNTFDDLPVDTRHTKAWKKVPEFPELWKRPQDAPVQRHRVVRTLVDAVKAKHDAEYVKSLTP